MKFFVTYQIPYMELDNWMKLPTEERKVQETQMQSEWSTWMAEHKGVVTEITGVGKPKCIAASGISDARNDLMMYSFVEAESLEVAAEVFKDHPHFGIPNSWIEVMPTNPNIS